MQVRDAVIDDIPTIVELTHQMQQENAPQIPIDEVHLIKQVLNAMAADHMCTKVVVTNDNVAVGFIYGYVSNYIFSKNLLAQQELWFVSKTYRSTRAPLLLLRSFMQWANERGACQVFFGALKNNLEDAEKITRIFEKLGCTHVGHYYRVENLNNVR
jgi:hypothetical protein